MKKTVQIMGIVAAIFLIIGFGLFILAGWGSLVEYHALEWRGVQHKGASPLTRATANLSYWFLGTGFLAGLFTFILRFTTTTKKTRKAQNKHSEQNKNPLVEGDHNQVDS
ncbi:hypothetical protein [Rothia dentocariosa]|uniref:hypothetical protein n=1 Tax=Rothia dentocariosa TaxID=2047 RepID=UPI00059E65F6|nr:hypothetical protein [Rothia dentocariosa]WMS31579.1 hypothetical protein RDV56_00370 [Rothia dentocariosa]SUE40137.1 Uncharacterised protein [Rothia dentocariosa]